MFTTDESAVKFAKDMCAELNTSLRFLWQHGAPAQGDRVRSQMAR